MKVIRYRERKSYKKQKKFKISGMIVGFYKKKNSGKFSQGNDMEDEDSNFSFKQAFEFLSKSVFLFFENNDSMRKMLKNKITIGRIMRIA